MSQLIINQQDYERGRWGCVLPEDIDPALFYTERQILPSHDPGAFAVDKLVKIVRVMEKGGYYVVPIIELSDDGEILLTCAKDELVTEDGIILKKEDTPDFERGYFLHGRSLVEDELQEWLEGALVPVKTQFGFAREEQQNTRYL